MLTRGEGRSTEFFGAIVFVWNLEFGACLYLVSCILCIGVFYLCLGVFYLTSRDSGNCACQPNQKDRFEAMRRFLLSEDPIKASSVISQVWP